MIVEKETNLNLSQKTKRRNQILNYIIRHWDELTNNLKDDAVRAIQEDGMDKKENVLLWWDVHKGVLVNEERRIRI